MITALTVKGLFSKVAKIFGLEKPFVKLLPAYSVKPGFSYVVKGIKIKNICKVLCLETPSFSRYKENHVTRNAPVKFRDFRETEPELCEQLLTKQTWVLYCKLLHLVTDKSDIKKSEMQNSAASKHFRDFKVIAIKKNIQ